jgi:predicted O-methyltransferase YrrM
MIDAVADATKTERSRIRTYYNEATGPVAELYDRRLRETITDGPGTRIRRKAVGFENWVGLDRLAWYCLLRAESPSTVVETGVKWGEGSLFALEAVRRNDHGELVSIDIGRDAMPSAHPWRTHHDEVGFFVPDDLRDRWRLIKGDAIEELHERGGSFAPVDVFYHDSKHTYEFIWDELQAVRPHMADNGLVACEDIDGMTVWSDILAEWGDESSGDWRFRRYSATEGAEIGLTRVRNDVRR